MFVHRGPPRPLTHPGGDGRKCTKREQEGRDKAGPLDVQGCGLRPFAHAADGERSHSEGPVRPGPLLSEGRSVLGWGHEGQGQGLLALGGLSEVVGVWCRRVGLAAPAEPRPGGLARLRGPGLLGPGPEDKCPRGLAAPVVGLPVTG